MTASDLASLPEYSLSIPSGTTIGKRWKRDVNARTGADPLWIIGKYVEYPDPGYVGIEWTRVEIVGAAASGRLLDGVEHLDAPPGVVIS